MAVILFTIAMKIWNADCCMFTNPIFTMPGNNAYMYYTIEAIFFQFYLLSTEYQLNTVVDDSLTLFRSEGGGALEALTNFEHL